MKHLFALLILLLSSFVLDAQEFCKPTSVFFDLNKSEIKAEGKQVIDSLIRVASGGSYILEVYGYTDTAHTDDYNRKLSQSRIEAVLNHFSQRKFTPAEILTFNEGEDFNSNEQHKIAAFQRRVDIYLTLTEGNNVVFQSSTGVTVRQERAYFGNCGICALKPKMNYLQTEEEANVNGIDLMTDKAEKLITYGMALFDIDTCASVLAGGRKKFRTCIEMPAPRFDKSVKLFELVEQPGNDVWRLLPDTINYDPKEKRMRFCTYSRKINCDTFAPGNPLDLILPEETMKSGKSFYIYYKTKGPERLFNDTVRLTSSVEKAISYFAIDRDWYLFQTTYGILIKDFYNRDSLSPGACSVYKQDYRVVHPVGEIELKVKLKDFDQIGYYNADYDLFVPLERTTGNTYSGQMYRDGFELCYIKKDRYYVEKNQARNIRFKQKDGLLKAKVKQAYLFKKNRLKWKRAKRQELK